MKKFNFWKIMFCVLCHNLILTNCEDITLWDNEDRARSQSSLTIRMWQNSEVDKGLLRTIIDTLRGQKFLPKCAMVGCTVNATQCVAHGGAEMVNKISVDSFTQAYFKSVFTMDKTFLSINCKNILVPCCFHRTVIDTEEVSAPDISNLSSSLPSKPQFVRFLNSLIPGMRPISIYFLSNICFGIGGDFGSVNCNKQESSEQDQPKTVQQMAIVD